MKVRYPVVAGCVYLGIGFFLYAYGVHDGTFVIADIMGGIVIYSFLSSLLSGR